MVTPGTPPIPHVGGPIILGSPTVITGGLPQARVGDTAICVGPPDVIVMGSTGVFVNSMPAARMGDQTAHGGMIAIGLPTVLIGETYSGSEGGAAGAGAGGVGASGENPGEAKGDIVEIPMSGAQLAFAQVAAQVQTLVDAANSGAPFCEVCFKNALAKAKDGLVR